MGNAGAYYGCSSNVLHTPPIVCSVQANTFLFFLRLYIFSPRKLLCPTKSARNAHRKQNKKNTKNNKNKKTQVQLPWQGGRKAHVQLRRRFKHTTTSINYAHVQLRVRHGDGIAKAHVQLQHGACTTTTKFTARSLSLAVDMRREKKQEGHRDGLYVPPRTPRT